MSRDPLIQIVRFAFSLVQVTPLDGDKLLEEERTIFAILDDALKGSSARPQQGETLSQWLRRRPETCEFRRLTEQKLRTMRPAVSFDLSEDRHEYVISNEDYKRGSEKERQYLLRHKSTLLRIFDNRCAKCGDDENAIDIDHFMFSKNEGGCFEMLHLDGHRVNNAIPLCESCNRSKSDRNFRDFFSNTELKNIFEKCSQMTIRLNEKKAS